MLKWLLLLCGLAGCNLPSPYEREWLITAASPDLQCVGKATLNLDQEGQYETIFLTLCFDGKDYTAGPTQLILKPPNLELNIVGIDDIFCSNYRQDKLVLSITCQTDVWIIDLEAVRGSTGAKTSPE